VITSDCNLLLRIQIVKNFSYIHRNAVYQVSDQNTVHYVYFLFDFLQGKVPKKQQEKSVILASSLRNLSLVNFLLNG
jgi:hypothetical protein